MFLKLTDIISRITYDINLSHIMAIEPAPKDLYRVYIPLNVRGFIYIDEADYQKIEKATAHTTDLAYYNK